MGSQDTCIAGIDLDTNTVDEYYDGVLFATHDWDDGNSGTIQCVDLYGNGASSVYYDDIVLQTLIEYQTAATGPSPARPMMGASCR